MRPGSVRVPSQGAPFGLSHSAVVLISFISRQAPRPPEQSHISWYGVGSETGKGRPGRLRVGCGCLDYIGRAKKLTYNERRCQRVLVSDSFIHKSNGEILLGGMALIFNLKSRINFL